MCGVALPSSSPSLSLLLLLFFGVVDFGVDRTRLLPRRDDDFLFGGTLMLGCGAVRRRELERVERGIRCYTVFGYVFFLFLAFLQINNDLLVKLTFSYI